MLSNTIPKEGGNTFRGSFLGNFANDKFQANNLTDELKAKGAEFKKRAQDGESLGVMLAEVFATVREVSKRTLGMRQFDVQLTGGVSGIIFNTINPSVYEGRAHPVPAKARYSGKDLQDWARVAGLKIKMPPSVFPVNSVKCMRGAFVERESRWYSL